MSLDIRKVMELLPHRYPFLLIDRVTEVEPGERLTALKNVTINEPFFNGHFPGKPVMPGVLITEALAQACCLLALHTAETDSGAIYYLAGIDKARFKRPVEPGDQLNLEVNLEKRRRDIWFFQGRVTVEGKVVASADIMCTAKDM